MKYLNLLFIASLLTFTACKKDCGEWEQQDGKDCINMTNKFIGTFVGVLTCGSQTDNIAATITAGTNNNYTLIFDGGDFYAELTGEEAFDFPFQPFGSTTMQGNGSISGNQLIFSFVLDPNGTPQVCSFSGSK